MSKKKKRKQKNNKPQLSKLDKFIYSFGFVALMSIAYILIINIFNLINQLYFLQNDVIAATPRLTNILIIPFLLFITLTPLGKTIENETKHKAIFGNKSVDYRRYSSELRPIFGKERNKTFTDKQKKARSRKFISWFIVFVVLGVVGFLGISGREILTSDGKVITYSVFNNAKEEYQSRDISKVKYSSYYSSGGRYTPDTYDYSIEIHILNTDKSYSFDNESFKKGKTNGISNSLAEMIRLKEDVYKNKTITFDIREDLNIISKHNNFSEKETELLFKVFEKEE